MAWVLIATVAACACKHENGHSGAHLPDSPPAANLGDRAPTRQAVPPASANAAAVVLTASDGSTHRVVVEIARTEKARRHGLMMRRHLPENAGMLFLMGGDEVHSFWMKNTLIPLDILFINQDYTVVGIVERATPLDKRGRSVAAVSRYVLEVNGGYCARRNIKVGSQVGFENVSLAHIESRPKDP